MTDRPHSKLTELDPSQPIWERFFMVAPLVLVGTRETDGGDDIAPKHMVTPLGWDNYLGFVCTPRHRTYHNAISQGGFTVSVPRPAQLLNTSLAASPRLAGGEKYALAALKTFRGSRVDAPLVEGSYLFLECLLERTVDGFGVNSLVVGRIVAACADPAVLRDPERDDRELLESAPLLAYLHPGRFAAIGESLSFPFPEGMKK